MITKPPKIESGILGIEICPKCKDFTCFVMPDYDLDTMEIIGYSCPSCKTGRKKYEDK